jgi:hypothetical protein
MTTCVLYILSSDIWNARQLERALIEDWPVHRVETVVRIILTIPLCHVRASVPCIGPMCGTYRPLKSILLAH